MAGEVRDRHGKYTLRWTGWKEFPDSLRLVGQWYAVADDDEFGDVAYASCPGNVGWLKPGHVMPIGWLSDENIPMVYTAPAIKERMKALTLARLVEFLEEEGK